MQGAEWCQPLLTPTMESSTAWSHKKNLRCLRDEQSSETVTAGSVGPSTDEPFLHGPPSPRQGFRASDRISANEESVQASKKVRDWRYSGGGEDEENDLRMSWVRTDNVRLGGGYELSQLSGAQPACLSTVFPTQFCSSWVIRVTLVRLRSTAAVTVISHSQGELQGSRKRSSHTHCHWCAGSPGWDTSAHSPTAPTGSASVCHSQPRMGLTQERVLASQHPSGWRLAGTEKSVWTPARPHSFRLALGSPSLPPHPACLPACSDAFRPSTKYVYRSHLLQLAPTRTWGQLPIINPKFHTIPMVLFLWLTQNLVPKLVPGKQSMLNINNQLHS